MWSQMGVALYAYRLGSTAAGGITHAGTREVVRSTPARRRHRRLQERDATWGGGLPRGGALAVGERRPGRGVCGLVFRGIRSLTQ
ncbi:hypothetical protein FB451DRAFT_1235525 [Mycena latifolia]|nr:hypothetical protein FB451DRAFT_1235525 [Mycena latifolia]